MSTLTDMERFWAKVDKSAECWTWTGYLNMNGYGSFYYMGRRVQPHRFAYITEIGAIPLNHDLDHLCRNPACVRPDHMEPVTHRENILRSSAATKTHCINGHEYTEANTYRSPKNGRRQCDTCRRQKMREYEQRNPGRKRKQAA